MLSASVGLMIFEGFHLRFYCWNPRSVKYLAHDLKLKVRRTDQAHCNSSDTQNHLKTHKHWITFPVLILNNFENLTDKQK